jgi:hypothetical protein
MIYTLCVEPINTNLRAELHLYQFQTTIIRVLSLHPYFRSNKFRPTTAVTTWSHQQSGPAGGSFPSTIAFGTTSCGGVTDKVAKTPIRVWSNSRAWRVSRIVSGLFGWLVYRIWLVCWIHGLEDFGWFAVRCSIAVRDFIAMMIGRLAYHRDSLVPMATLRLRLRSPN